MRSQGFFGVKGAGRRACPPTRGIFMKRNAVVICCWIGAFLAQVHWICAQTAPPQQPVYIFLTTSVGDHVNWAISEERLRRTLPVVEKYRKDAPSLAANVYFSGAVSDAMSQHNAQDHLLDFVRGFVQRGAVLPGYDGSEEPTYEHRPMLDFSGTKNAEDRWLARMSSAGELLSQARDPLTGAPQPGRSGGLKRMQEVFGPPAALRGVVLQIPNLWGPVDEVGSDSEIVNELRQFSATPLMVGLDESNLAKTAAESYRPFADTFSKVLSPAANTSPEVFWQEDVLRLSEASLADWRTFRAEDGVDKLKAALARLDRSHIRVLRVEIGGQRAYVKPPVPPMGHMVMPVNWAYRHPDNPLFPDKLRYSAVEMDAKYAQEEAVLKYLVSEFLPANQGSRFVSSTDIKSLAKPGWGYDLSLQDLKGSVAEMLTAWGDKTTPPTYLKVGDRYLSLADLFGVLTDALAQQSRSGRFPASIRVGHVFGPVLTATPKSPVEGEVTAESVGRVCANLVDALHDDSWSPRPHNAIPSPVEIESLSVTPAQFLRLMAEALVAPAPGTKLRIKPTDMFAGRIMTFNSRRLTTELGAPWTYKPAVLDTSATSSR